MFSCISNQRNAKENHKRLLYTLSIYLSIYLSVYIPNLYIDWEKLKNLQMSSAGKFVLDKVLSSNLI